MTTSARGGMPYVVSFMAAAFLGVLPAKAGNYAFFDPDESGSRLWSHSAAWYTCGDYKNDQMSHRGNISSLGTPGDGKVVMVDSNLLTPEMPLKIDDGRSVEVSQLHMASYLGAPYGDEPHMVALEVGAGAKLSISSNSQNFKIGECDGGQALLLVDDNAVVSNDYLYIGASGLGIVTNRGGRIFCLNNNSARGLFLGSEATGTGVVTQTSGSMNLKYCRVGCNGVGRMEILGGVMSGGTFYVGEKSGGRGTVVLDGVAVTNTQITIGCSTESWGCLHLRGSTNFVSTMRIRDNESAYGQLRGWGMVYSYSASAASGEMNGFYMNGQAIADGEGVDGRVLDFRLARSGSSGKYNVRTSIANGVSGTNGWYAVNRGVLAYPMLVVSSASWSGTFGDNTNTVCDAVNTVRIDYNQTSNKGPWLEAQLYANDSAMVPTGLEGQVLGVWGFRSNVKYDDRSSQLANLTDFSLRFRYDHRSLKPKSRISLMRYNQALGEWQRISGVEHDPASPFISATALTADGAEYDRNLGVFAVVDEGTSGFMIVVR